MGWPPPDTSDEVPPAQADRLNQRLPTGAGGLDDLLDGGLPEGSWVVVVGAPGSGKTTLGRQFLHTAASRNRRAVLLSTADSPELVRQGMVAFGWEEGATARIEYLNFYSWRQGMHDGLDTRNLTDASIAITRFFDGQAEGRNGSPCLVIDSFTDFLLHNQVEAVLSFLGQLRSRLQRYGTTALILLEDGIHPVNVVATTEYVTDGTIRTKFDETGRYLMVSRMRNTPVTLGWSKFTINKGIELILRNFFGASGA